jgi:hypothetical protein
MNTFWVQRQRLGSEEYQMTKLYFSPLRSSQLYVCLDNEAWESDVQVARGLFSLNRDFQV